MNLVLALQYVLPERLIHIFWRQNNLCIHRNLDLCRWLEIFDENHRRIRVDLGGVMSG